MKELTIILLLFLSFISISCRSKNIKKKQVESDFTYIINKYFYCKDKQLFTTSLLSKDSSSDLNNFLYLFSKIEQDSFSPDSIQNNLNESSPYYYIIKSIILFDTDTFASKENIKKSLNIDSNNFFALLWYCNFFRMDKNEQECINAYNYIVSNYSDIALGYYYFVDYYISISKYEEAEKILKTTTSKFNKSHLFYNQKSFIEVKKGNINNAIESLKLALELNYNIESLKLLGGIYLFELQNYNKALEILEEGLILSNTDFELLNMLAEAYWFNNNLEKSEYFYLEALKNIKYKEDFNNVFADYLDFILLEKGKDDVMAIINNANYKFSIEDVSIIYYIIIDLKYNNNVTNAINIFKIYKDNYPDKVQWAKDRIYNWYQTDW